MNFNKEKPTGSLISSYSQNLGTAIINHRADIAERARRIEAERTSQITSQFIANMSHELRTPLNSIIGFSDLLKKHGQPGSENLNVAEYGEIINQGAAQLLSIINEILDISRIQSGKMTIDQEDIYIDEIAHSCSRMFMPQVKSKSIQLKISLAKKMPAVRADVTKTRQILTNLIGNAIKFTPEKGTVHVKAYPKDNKMVNVEIIDSGVGMSEEDIEVALTPFGQIETEFSRSTQGTGLGLPITKALVEMHGGELSIVSARGKGTKIIVSLPISKSKPTGN